MPAYAKQLQRMFGWCLLDRVGAHQQQLPVPARRAGLVCSDSCCIPHQERRCHTIARSLCVCCASVLICLAVPVCVQALAAAMRKLQEEWWVLVVQLEHQLKLGQLNLAALLYYCQAPSASLALLANIAVRG